VEIAYAGFQVGTRTGDPVGAAWGVRVLEPAGAEQFTLECTLDAARFDIQTAERWLGNFGVLLNEAVTNPDCPVWELPLLTMKEQHDLHRVWNDTATDALESACIHELFERQGQRTPDGIAVGAGARSLTFRQLDERANRLAHLLRARNVMQGSLVGICVDPSVEGVVASLATLKSGGAFVPLDVTHPPARLRTILSDAGVQVLLSTESRLDLHSAWAPDVFALDGDWEDLFRTPDRAEPPQPRPTREDIAIVSHPPAATGRPQGVVLQHHQVVNTLSSRALTPGLAVDDVSLGSRSVAESAGIIEHFLPLCAGATLAIVPAEIAQDGALLAQAIERTGATIVHAHASTWRAVLRSGWQGAAIRVLVSGDVTSAFADELCCRVQSVWHLYGLDETGGCSAVHPLRGADARPVIGHPIENTAMHVLDSHGNLVPIGVPGELHVGGAGVADGYLSCDLHTMQGFVTDPFSHKPARRLFRTGDRVRRLPDGTLKHLGRISRRREIGGLRIDLAEIEYWLRTHDEVEDAIVVTRVGEGGEPMLCAYLTTVGGAAPSPQELHGFLATKLPQASCPNEFVILTRMPRAVSGALDEGALRTS